MALWNLKDQTILVVDDLPEMRSIMRGMLATYTPAEIRQARNGDEAIEALAGRRFDLVMCDYNLGEGRDGQQVLEEARYRDLLPHATVFVMVTAENNADMVMGALEHQPDAYLSKPIPKTTLHSRVRKLMEKKAALLDICRALDAKEHERALSLCDARLQGDTRYRYSLLEMRCHLLERLGRHDEVQAMCEAILADRELPWASLALGKVHFGYHADDLALETFEDLVEYSPNAVGAYDWLGRTLARLGESSRAQAMLQRAVERSPKSLPRQRLLGEIAMANGDTTTAERARRAALRVGHSSVMKRPRDHAELARALIANDSPREALGVLEAIGAQYPGDVVATLESAVPEIALQRAFDDDEKARDAMERALEAFRCEPASLRVELAPELLAALLALCDPEQADELARHLVRNHHDDDAVLERVRELYRAAGHEEAGEKLVATARAEAVRINNEGVQLLKQGRVEESVELFARAVKGMPLNPVVNLNAARSLTMAMQRGRVTRRRLGQALACLKVVREAETHHSGYRELLHVCNGLSSARPARAGATATP